MTRFIVCILTLVALATTACAPSAPSKQDPELQTPAYVANVAPTASNVPVQTPTASEARVNVTPSPGATPTVAPTFAPNPLNVQVKLDTQISASAVISTTGGTLKVQGADGTQFTLTFPKDALLQDTKVTLTPVTTVDGLPFSGGLVGGVQMAPEGLRLLEPATLTIESAKTVAPKGFETVAFGYHQSGEGMYLNPSDAKGNILTLEIWHFSGAGVAQGTGSEIETQQQRNVPSNPEDALAQRVQEYLRQKRQAQQNGGKTDPDFEKRMTEFAREWYDRFIGPQLPVALQDCEAAPEISSKALNWLRQVMLLGIDQNFQPERALIRETINQATVNCYNKEYDQCVIDRNIKHRTAMLGHYRQAMLMGIEGRLDRTKIQKCAPQFHVDQVVADGRLHLTGSVCALDKPFTLKIEGSNAGLGVYVGQFSFTPAGESGGSWTHMATTTCLPEVGCGTVSASGSYQAQGGAEGKVNIIMNETTQTISFGGEIAMPGWQFELVPGAGAGECSAE